MVMLRYNLRLHLICKDNSVMSVVTEEKRKERDVNQKVPFYIDLKTSAWFIASRSMFLQSPHNISGTECYFMA